MKRLPLALTVVLAVCGPGIEDIQSASISDGRETTTYVIPRYVIGSGGVAGVVGTNYHHAATAGEAPVEVLQGPNNVLLSGFWLPTGYWPPGIEDEEAEVLPTTFHLHRNYPNPFNPQTVIRYDLPFESLVAVEIFNIVGQRICLVSSQVQGPGHEQVSWDGRDERGHTASSGVYLYRVTASKANAGRNNADVLFQQTQKMLLVK